MPVQHRQIKGRSAVLNSQTQNSSNRVSRHGHWYSTQDRRELLRRSIRHPNKYSDETGILPPTEDGLIEKLKNQTALDMIPDQVLWAGATAARNRNSIRSFSGANSEYAGHRGSYSSTMAPTAFPAQYDYYYGDQGRDSGVGLLSQRYSVHPVQTTISSNRRSTIHHPASLEVAPSNRTTDNSSSTSSGSHKKSSKNHTYLRRKAVLAWKYVTALTRRLQIKKRRDKTVKRDSNLPDGFEWVQVKTPFWKRNSSRRRQESRCQQPNQQ